MWSDIDECATAAGYCGPNCECINNPGSYNLVCKIGFQATNDTNPPSSLNPCIGKVHKVTQTLLLLIYQVKNIIILYLFEDIDECVDNACGDYGTCLNTVGSFNCKCFVGFEIIPKGDPLCQGQSSVMVKT